MKLYDPPELAANASRGDPPMEVWPGKPIGRQQLMMAAGGRRLTGLVPVQPPSTGSRASMG